MYPRPEMGLSFRASPTKVAYTATQGRLALLPPGMYYLTSDQECYVLQGGVAVTADTDDSPLWKDAYLLIQVTDASDGYVSAVQVSAGGTLWAIPAKPPAAR